MVELQILNKVLSSNSDDIITRNEITDDYFNQYHDEWKFISDHKKEFGNIPDKETFLEKFPDFDILNVTETENYLVNKFREEHLYSITVPVLTKVSDLLQEDSNQAVEYFREQLPTLKINTCNNCERINDPTKRLEEYLNTSRDRDNAFVETGFKELDESIGGFHLGEELVVLFARTGQGKTWVLMKMLEHMWKMNKTIGLLEPEMTATKVGYRFDTVHKHFSNKDLMWGNKVDGYEEYCKELAKSKVDFFVAHPKDFNREVTVAKLRTWVENNNISVLAIDGISYMTDQRKDRNDNKTTQLTHISEDLMDLSIDLKIPIIVVCQSNREGAKEDDLAIENIRDSDGIAYNASLVLTVMQKEPGLILSVIKSRNSATGIKLPYMWEANTGEFKYLGENDSYEPSETRRAYSEGDDVF